MQRGGAPRITACETLQGEQPETLMPLTAAVDRVLGLLLEYSKLSDAPGAMARLGVPRVYVQWPALDCNVQPAPGTMLASSQTLLLEGRSKLMLGVAQVLVPVFFSTSVPW
jgi:hypothetical protein